MHPLPSSGGVMETFRAQHKKERTMRIQNRWMLLALAIVLSALGGVPQVVEAQGVPNANHYKCYDIINPPSMTITVNLVDQFGTQAGQVVRPRYLCNPVKKNNSAVPNPNLHYVCYELLVPPLPVAKSARVTNQFGTLDVQVQQARLLCLPSSKILLG
jgi:hypothetical protein